MEVLIASAIAALVMGILVVVGSMHIGVWIAVVIGITVVAAVYSPKGTGTSHYEDDDYRSRGRR